MPGVGVGVGAGVAVAPGAALEVGAGVPVLAGAGDVCTPGPPVFGSAGSALFEDPPPPPHAVSNGSKSIDNSRTPEVLKVFITLQTVGLKPTDLKLLAGQAKERRVHAALLNCIGAALGCLRKFTQTTALDPSLQTAPRAAVAGALSSVAIDLPER